VIYPLRARLKELKDANPNSQGKDNTPEAKLKDLKNGEQRGHQIETNRGRIQDIGLNPSHPKSQRGMILLPHIKRSRQTSPRKSNQLDPKSA